jgi:hypothetical protein
MDGYIDSKLIIVEGLTGSGKSIMAHFIARQLQYNGIPASWVHEAEVPHPLSIDIESSIEDYMSEMLERWSAYVALIESSGEVIVIEASFFNNLIDDLLIHNVERSRISQYGEALQAIIEPLNPFLVYLVQEDVGGALRRNFANRGKGFEDFVIHLSTSTPLAKQRGWEGYEGMVMFWREFVSVTDELFQKYHIRKLMLDTSTGNWDDCRRQVMESLSLPLRLDPIVTKQEALELVGVYKDQSSDKEFTVQYEAGELTVDIFLKVRTRLVKRAEKVFLTEGWHFEISFEAADGSSRINRMRIGGRDVDYLSLVGTVAEKMPV